MGNMKVGTAAVLFSVILSALFFGSGVLGYELKIIVLFCIALLTVICRRQGTRWTEIMDGYAQRVKEMAPVFLIILGIGYLIAALMVSGTSPVLVCIMTRWIDPDYILLLSFLLVTSLSCLIGTSFASIGTLGIIMYNAAVVQSIPPVVAAAAVISGAVYGGFISPFNDNMNATPGLYKMSVYEVIRKLRLPFLLSVIMTSGIFWFLGTRYTSSDTVQIQEILYEFRQSVEECFHVNMWCVLPLVTAIVLAIRKVNIIINLFVSGTIGMVFGVFVQGFPLKKCVYALYWGFQTSQFFPDREVENTLAFLLNRGGIYSMAEVLSFLLLMLVMAELLNRTGIFKAFHRTRLHNIKNPFLLTVMTFISCQILTLVTLDGIPTGVVSKDMLSDIYIKAGYDPRKIARISVVTCNWLGNWIPWSFCANYFADVCGVSVWAVMPYTLCLILPTLVMLIQSAIGRDNEKLEIRAE